MKERIARDGYFTPGPLALAITQRLADLGVRPRTILEPSSGGGAFVRAARATWPGSEISAVDVSPTAEIFARAAGADFINSDFRVYRPAKPFDLVVGNPPYNDASVHVAHASMLASGVGVVAFLLRLSFVGSRERAMGICAGPGRHLAPIVPRPSFTSDGATDSSEYGLFVWGLPGPSTLGEPLFWEKAPRSRAPTPDATTHVPAPKVPTEPEERNQQE